MSEILKLDRKTWKFIAICGWVLEALTFLSLIAFNIEEWNLGYTILVAGGISIAIGISLLILSWIEYDMDLTEEQKEDLVIAIVSGLCCIGVYCFVLLVQNLNVW